MFINKIRQIVDLSNTQYPNVVKYCEAYQNLVFPVKLHKWKFQCVEQFQRKESLVFLTHEYINSSLCCPLFSTETKQVCALQYEDTCPFVLFSTELQEVCALQYEETCLFVLLSTERREVCALQYEDTCPFVLFSTELQEVCALQYEDTCPFVLFCTERQEVCAL
jgi:hypothetical protein